MARRKIAPAATGVTVAAAAIPERANSRSAAVRWPLRLAAAGTVGWTLALLTMVVTADGTPRVSRDQVRHAAVVIVGRTGAAGSLQVETVRVLGGAVAAGDKLDVLNLDLVPGVMPQSVYVFPLSRFRGDYRIVVLDGQEGPPLIELATPGVVEQVRQFLIDGRP